MSFATSVFCRTGSATLLARALPSAHEQASSDSSLAEPFTPTLRSPRTWSEELYTRAMTVILGRFLLHYRAFQAYGGPL
jgi:hypothetical protein